MAGSGNAGHTQVSLEALRLLGGHICLDFTNTIEPRMGKESHDLLTSYAALVQWSQRAGVLSEEEARVLLKKAALHAEETVLIWQQAIELRECIYRIFSAIAHKREPPADDLETLKRTFIAAMAHAQIVATANGFAWKWATGEDAPDRMVWSLVYSAIELLTSEEVKRVKQCPGLGDCGWLFLDNSKNNSRQWCSMEGCGSRAKMRQLYARRRGKSNSQ
jgi:predicted RNA-binding Zn ribbon-like protein